LLRVEFASLSSIPSRIDVGDDVLVVMPFIDPAAARRSATQLAGRSGRSGLLLGVYDEEGAGFIAIANRVFGSSRSGYFAYVAQDAFAGRGWLAAGVAALEGGPAGLLAFNDGKWSGHLASFGLVRRTWAASQYGPGGLFHEGYRRHYADAELTLLAQATGQFAYDPNAVLVEVDWGKDQADVDPADRRLFAERAARGFDGRVTDPRLLRRFR